MSTQPDLSIFPWLEANPVLLTILVAVIALVAPFAIARLSTFGLR